ncbi:MAG: energy transducer TonB [Novosphingobium sp.]|nr:energy transducer TonB [Novosphingobium sp.]
MAYADQQLSGNRITAFIVVAVIHVILGYALVTGLAYDAVRHIVKTVTTVDIKKEEPKKEPPPPPPKQKEAPPPPVAPPVRINVQTAPPQITTVVTPPPPMPVLIPQPPAPPPPPPPPAGVTKDAAPRGNPADWATTNDYPSRALREERQGTTGFRVTVGPDGRVTDCEVTSSSGSPDLDEATCANVRRRARFTPAMENGQPTTGHYSNRIRWVIPKD